MTDFDRTHSTGLQLDASRLRALVDSGPTPLFATVSGAHLYGFASADSDVDLRGAYVMPLSERLGLRKPEETITIMRDEHDLELDWVAHDIKKFATLMTKRNGYVLEQLYSPLVIVGGDWHDELKAIGHGCAVRHLVHHYRGFAHNQRRLVDGNEPTVKNLLYAYRVYLTGIHVLRTGRIEANLSRLNEDRDVDGLVELLTRKRTGAEKGLLEPGEAKEHAKRLDALERELNSAFETSNLPDEPTTFDELSDFVARASLELGSG